MTEKKIYSVSEFSKFDIESMQNIVKNSYEKDFEELENKIKNNNLNTNTFLDTYELIYVSNEINKHVGEIIKYCNYSLLKYIYLIYFYSKQNNYNVYQYIYNEYKNKKLNVCFTKQSDVTLLLLNIYKMIRNQERTEG